MLHAHPTVIVAGSVVVKRYVAVVAHVVIVVVPVNAGAVLSIVSMLVKTPVDTDVVPYDTIVVTL